MAYRNNSETADSKRFCSIGRWQVERSFAWLNFFRRLDKDHERLPESSVAFIQVAFINILLK
ncbi:transposase [Chitinophaga sancti]|uniref:transposase n=1 Tax=Chitinophaga sancti TaxID=1004 RepID=UPI0009FA45CC